MTPSVSGLVTAFERGELTMLFEPIVDLSTFEILGANATPHWRGVDEAWLPLLDDPAAEAAGRFFVREALRPLPVWRARAGQSNVTVGISGAQVLEPWWQSELAAALEGGIDPASVTVLVPTGHAQVPAVARALARIRASGFRVALDHFGLADTDLGVAQRVPVDELRLDASIASQLEDPVVLAAVALLFHRRNELGVDITATGIADEAARYRLWSLGCRRGQGPLTGRPMTADALTTAIRHR